MDDADNFDIGAVDSSGNGNGNLGVSYSGSGVEGFINAKRDAAVGEDDIFRQRQKARLQA
jgi:hypothetical protein